MVETLEPWPCSRCGLLIASNIAHACPPDSPSRYAEPITELSEYVPGSTGHVEVIIDVAAVLAKCGNVEEALAFLRGVNAIFVEGEEEATS